MPSIRQDAWTHEEDVKLAEIVLRHIKEGSTQLAGFAEAGRLLSRTSAACGFRWNSAIRKIYQQALHEAKEIRKESKKEKKRAADLTNENDIKQPGNDRSTGTNDYSDAEPDIDQVIRFLNQLKTQSAAWDHSEQVSEQLNSLKIENKLLDEAYHKLQKDYSHLKHNYESLLQVLKAVDEARKEIPALNE
ncbi:RsfA family transcriptional regulator [Sporolactobacillus shoreicorticis]|uniref:RsfA family transcriptional regulator n=1 Tax=Sporolactobacillus shoreicorticis TaxID=1923877 RepID=A0ABW5S4T8_9BACL|nr:RsfA family transcriptional regulator [Sporolactobacillus shoreicorticis]